MEWKWFEFPGAFYHAIQRGKNRKSIFRNDADKASYFNHLVER